MTWMIDLAKLADAAPKGPYWISDEREVGLFFHLIAGDGSGEICSAQFRDQLELAAALSPERIKAMLAVIEALDRKSMNEVLKARAALDEAFHD